MLRVVCWKWTQPGYRDRFTAWHVNVLRRMVARHYADAHEFVCITDDPRGLEDGIRVIPLWNDFGDVSSPHGSAYPSCYRRLRAFSEEAAETIGPRFVSLDLDTCITRDLRPVWNRPEDFVIWGDTTPRSYYNGSMFLMTAGARRQVFEQFDPKRSPAVTRNARLLGSDQAWISYVLGRGQPMWSIDDGVYSFRNHLAGRADLPADARIVFFHGHKKPWNPNVQRSHPWIVEHYR